MKRGYETEDLRVPETPPAGEDPKPWAKTRVVGTRVPRVDGYERVSGTAVYPSDVVLPGMLYGAILRCPHPHAKVRRVDASKARGLPGVRAIVDATTPEADLTWPWSGSTTAKLFDRHCRFEGEAVAAVAADTPWQARDALRAIEVDYEVLPFVVDPEAALKDGAPKVHDAGNVAGRDHYARGDVEKGFAEADVVLEETYRTAAEIHTPMELHGCVARWDGTALTIWESTQGVFAVQQNAADVLGLPLAKVRVIGHYMGGGFGSKLKAGKWTIVAAVLAKVTARPVKLFLSREETYLTAGNRPPAVMRLKIGAKKDGTLTALDFHGIGTGGAYPAGGTSLLDFLVRDLYACPNVRTETVDAFVNAGPARPFRAPGHPQGAFALEQAMDALAVKLGMDPVALRRKNVPEVSQARGGIPYTMTGLDPCLAQGRQAFDWDAARTRVDAHNAKGGPTRRGLGVASCLWIAGAGGPPSTVIVKLFSDGSVNLNLGASDIGTGTKTVMAMVVAEELGVPPDAVQIENADTETTQFATPSGGSKTVPTESPAVRAAAVAVKRALLDLAADDLGVPAAELSYAGEAVVSTKDPTKRVKVTEIEGLRRRGLVLGVGYRGPNPEGVAIRPFAAHFCEVEVDTRTGETKVLRLVAAQDSGRVMDRLTYDNQVHGGLTMGLGYALTESRILDEGQTGKMVNANWHEYKIPTALDAFVEMTSLPLDRPDPQANLTGAKGLGEPVTIPTAAAIANAIHDACGVRPTETPIDPVHLVRRLAAGKEG